VVVLVAAIFVRQAVVLEVIAQTTPLLLPFLHPNNQVAVLLLNLRLLQHLELLIQ
jgi:hypothetical protein